MKPVHSVAVGLVALVASFGVTGCATSSYGGQTSKAAQNGLLGTLLGAGLGAIVGHQSGETEAGAALGAAVGGIGGYVLGNEQDKTQMQAQTAQALQSANTVLINVKNTNGSVTPVTLTRQGNFYVGPRGEQYIALPTEDQLRPVYGF